DVGRRAADARDRPGDDGPAEAPAPRRALARPRAGHRRPHLRGRPRDQRPGHHDRPGRAERQLRARRVGPGLRARDGPRRAERHVREPAQRRARASRVPGGLTTMHAAFFVLAAVGAKAFYLLMIWLASAIVAAELSKRKGYGEKWGLG